MSPSPFNWPSFISIQSVSATWQHHNNLFSEIVNSHETFKVLKVHHVSNFKILGVLFVLAGAELTFGEVIDGQCVYGRQYSCVNKPSVEWSVFNSGEDDFVYKDMTFNCTKTAYNKHHCYIDHTTTVMYALVWIYSLDPGNVITFSWSYEEYPGCVAQSLTIPCRRCDMYGLCPNGHVQLCDGTHEVQCLRTILKLIVLLFVKRCSSSKRNWK